ncbi:MAG: radical SAM protein [bacterium]
MVTKCNLCGHRCGVERGVGKFVSQFGGKCGAGDKIKVASYCLHHGEEPQISGQRGSGTVFFSGCSLKCVYCQNYQVSQQGLGREVTINELVKIMLDLADRGAENINLVSPTHYGAQVIDALMLAKKEGLELPIVYNTGGYDSLELLQRLDGLVDIYLPDIKYFDNDNAFKYSGAENYVETVTVGVREMWGQVVRSRECGVGRRALIVRHLVLPNNIADSFKVLDFLAGISTEIWLSLMSQYSPQHRAKEFPELARKLTAAEYEKVVDHAQDKGFQNIYIQHLSSSDAYLPDFKKKEPFSSQ